MRSPYELASATLFRARRRGTGRLIDGLEQRQWWSTERLVAYGEERARALAIHAGAHTAYYRRLFAEHRVDPVTLRFPEDWARLPVLTKTVLKSHFDGLRAAEAWQEDARPNTTGGSTGTPVRFLSDKHLFELMDAFFHVVQRWAGWRPGEPVLHFWGGQGAVTPSLGWELRARLAGRAVVPVYSYDERSFASWWAALDRLRPTVIHAYPSVLASFAGWLEETGREPRPVKAVLSSAEVLTPEHRRRIERVFRTRVYNQYGSRETPCVACECPLGNMHVFVDLNHVEFPDAGAGPEPRPGRILVTPLLNRVQPLLRYDLDDVGAPQPGRCPCGRGYPLMQLTIGRKRDALTAADGRRVYAGFVTRLMDGEEWVERFQFRQRGPDLLELAVKPAAAEGPTDAARRAELLAGRILPPLREMMGEGLDLSVRVVDAIDLTQAGKHRFVVNDMEPRT